jgi:hypothetical protein
LVRSSPRYHALLRTRAPLMWLTRLLKTSLRSSAPLVWQLPPRGSSHLAVFDAEAPVLSNEVTFLRLRPHFRVLPELHAVCSRTNGRTLLRSFAPAAQPTRQGLPLSGFTCPSHVASSHLPCASTLYSLDELPGVLSTRRAHGASPFRALPNRDRCRLSAEHPLLRLAYRSRQTLGLLFPHTSPRLVVRRLLIEQTS